jgi:two-component system sensor histidine kinase/response regulator
MATNGEQALRRCQNAAPPELIPPDVMMPDIDGYEVCRRLKADPKTANIPVIFVTAMGAATDETKGFELGAVDYIVKPVSPEIVRARVRAHVELALARRALHRQNDQLEEAMQRAEDMENLMRHDLKGPLGVIIGFPQLLLEEEGLKDSQESALRKIENAGFRMLNMIDLSLDLAKMERGLYVVNPEKLDFRVLLKQMIDDQETILRIKNLDVNISYDGGGEPDGPVIFHGEALLVQSMLSNLFKNACEASPEDETLDIMVNTGDSIELNLRNTGVAPASIRDRFFEKYASSGKKGGTGLGTYSAKLIATALGGDIRLDSTEPGRTSVVVNLPSRAPDPA